MRKSTVLIKTLVSVLPVILGTPPSEAALAPTQDWANRYDGPEGISTAGVDIALDSSGGVYITGTHRASIGQAAPDWDFATVKYGVDGARLWAKRYDGPESYTDSSSGLALDAAGNVYVAGESFGPSAGWDFATLKYDGSGNVQWESRYDSSASGSVDQWEKVTTVQVDSSGNVIVAGTSGVFEQEILVVKYDTAGNQVWTYHYSAADYTIPAETAVDASGNIYLTGWYSAYSNPNWGTPNLLILKLNASGAQQWVATYGGGEGRDIAVDAAGNAYVTGRDSNNDYVTIKYNSAGTQQWVATYDGANHSLDVANAIALDAAGNAYVTGTSAEVPYASYLTTVKYSSSGTEEWIASYVQSPGYAESNAGKDVVVDTLGNVYVTGGGSSFIGTYVTVKYNSSGTQQWAVTYDSPEWENEQALALAIDGTGGVYVTGWSGNGIATVKYNSSGTELWVDRYVGPAKDEANAVATDLWGNAYVVGNSSPELYFSVSKYNTSGDTVWTNSGSGEANAVVVDDEGNVYVTGVGRGSPSTMEDYATRKYDRGGALLWTAYYDGPSHYEDKAYAVAVDAAGNVYVTGASSGSGYGYPDYATVKYDSAGNLVWSARFDGPANGPDSPSAIAVDGAGNVYVTGSGERDQYNSDYLTVKYNSSGAQQWAAWYSGPANVVDHATALAIDHAGNVFVTGRSDGSQAGSPDYSTIKYDASGTELWVARYDGPSGGWDEAAAMVLDPEGYLYVTGTSGWDYHDYATVKYDDAGNELWVARYDGSGTSYDAATAIEMDVWGNVYVTGKSIGTDTGYDYATVKYDKSGNEQWVVRYDGPGGKTDKPRGIGLDGLGNVYVTGASDGGDTGYDWATIKYAVAPLPEDAALDIAERVWALVESGLLTAGQGNALTVKLEQAAKWLEIGKTKIATRLLTALTYQIEDLVVAGVLTPDEATPLLEATQNLLIYIAGESG